MGIGDVIDGEVWEEGDMPSVFHMWERRNKATQEAIERSYAQSPPRQAASPAPVAYYVINRGGEEKLTTFSLERARAYVREDGHIYPLYAGPALRGDPA